jgi:hypothetical protein
MTAIVLALIACAAMFGLGYGHGRSVWRRKLARNRADLRLVLDRPEVGTRIAGVRAMRHRRDTKPPGGPEAA